jgi:uncharacterized protein YjhX (UPF0386 family)
MVVNGVNQSDLTMDCLKCGGQMNFERFVNGVGDTFAWSYEGWHCIQCGETIDPVILFNRMKAKTLVEVADQNDQIAM